MPMRKYLTVASSFAVMLCLGGVYAWSIIASELIASYSFSFTESQVVFGTLIAVFPASMILSAKLAAKVQVRILGITSGVFFISGYLLGGLSGGSFFTIFLGIGLIAGIGTGFGYWMALTVPVQWFPGRKGLVTGIVSAGFGLGAVVFSYFTETMMAAGMNILQVMAVIGASYGVLIIIFSNLISSLNEKVSSAQNVGVKLYIMTPVFRNLFSGIFLGTFAGLLFIGSLKLIGDYFNISKEIVILSVSLFAVSNFAGRLLWGFLSDYTGAVITVFFSLLLQAVSIILYETALVSDYTFPVFSVMAGLGFGGNFVTFAKETAHVFGVENLGTVYPYVFLGYALAGITGPFFGGLLFDISGAYTIPIYLAGIMSLGGSIMYLVLYLRERKGRVPQN